MCVVCATLGFMNCGCWWLWVLTHLASFQHSQNIYPRIMVFWLSSFRDLGVKTGLCFRLHTHSFVNGEPRRLLSKWWVCLLAPSVGGRQNWHASASADFMMYAHFQVEPLSKGASVISKWSSDIFLFLFSSIMKVWRGTLARMRYKRTKAALTIIRYYRRYKVKAYIHEVARRFHGIKTMRDYGKHVQWPTPPKVLHRFEEVLQAIFNR